MHRTLATAAISALAAFAATHESLSKLMDKTYIELSGLPELEFSQKQFQQARARLEARRKADLESLQQQARKLKQQDEALRRQLETLNLKASRDTEAMEAERHLLHCRILTIGREARNNRAERRFGMTAKYNNAVSKLAMVERWPARRQEIRQEVANGDARGRHHGDCDDIGIRKLGEGQDRDVQLGMDGIREMRGQGLMPPELGDDAVATYVRRLAQDIASNSDLRVPVKASVLASDEINAFALPGGFLFVNTGLIQSCSRGCELAGVLSHEIAHAAGRHGYKLTRGLSVRNLVMEGTQMAANVFSSGATGTATHYVREYGVFGLGMALNVKLLGVSPDTEAEAHQLGIQYLWRAGYDPRGFIEFFDKMAGEANSVRTISFFHTHPAYPDAILSTFSELEYLPVKRTMKADSQRFHEIQTAVARRMHDVRGTTSEESLAGCEDGGALRRTRAEKSGPRIAAPHDERLQ